MRFFPTFSFYILFVTIVLSGCASTSVDMSKGAYKVGKPYQVNGKKYYPEVDYEYRETGLASWYGPGFDGKKTANGERFNQNELTAAHRTLPMPSIVQETNLENGKSVMVRINDRGPFAHSRIIDVSKRTAELLGFKNKGTAKVRVTILEQESRKIAGAAMSGQDTSQMVSLEQNPNYQTASVISKKPAPHQSLKLQTKNKYVVSGHLTEGRFYPDHIVSQEPVKPTHIFVQAGAFSTRENAEKLAEALSEFGEGQIKPVSVQGKMYYRVRLPVQMDEVDAADMLLNRVVWAGYKNALIVVD